MKYASVLKSIKLPLILILGLLSAPMASALINTDFNFDPSIPVNNTVQDAYRPDLQNVWYPDRRPTAGFESAFFDGDNRARATINSADYDASVSYNNTQGYTYNTPQSVSFSVDLYLDSSWQSLNNTMRVGLWAEGRNTGNAAGVLYPIISFGTDGSPGDFQFRIFDGNAGGWQALGDFNALGQAGNLAWNSWYNLGFSLDQANQQIDYFINGELVYTATDLPAINEELLQRVMLQANNNAENYTVYWDNLTVSAIPEPSAYAAMAGLLALSITWLRRRK